MKPTPLILTSLSLSVITGAGALSACGGEVLDVIVSADGGSSGVSSGASGNTSSSSGASSGGSGNASSSGSSGTSEALVDLSLLAYPYCAPGRPGEFVLACYPSAQLAISSVVVKGYDTYAARVVGVVQSEDGTRKPTTVDINLDASGGTTIGGPPAQIELDQALSVDDLARWVSPCGSSSAYDAAFGICWAKPTPPTYELWSASNPFDVRFLHAGIDGLGTIKNSFVALRGLLYGGFSLYVHKDNQFLSPSYGDPRNATVLCDGDGELLGYTERYCLYRSEGELHQVGRAGIPLAAHSLGVGAQCAATAVLDGKTDTIACARTTADGYEVYSFNVDVPHVDDPVTTVAGRSGPRSIVRHSIGIGGYYVLDDQGIVPVDLSGNIDDTLPTIANAPRLQKPSLIRLDDITTGRHPDAPPGLAGATILVTAYERTTNGATEAVVVAVPIARPTP